MDNIIRLSCLSAADAFEHRKQFRSLVLVNKALSFVSSNSSIVYSPSLEKGVKLFCFFYQFGPNFISAVRTGHQSAQRTLRTWDDHALVIQNSLFLVPRVQWHVA